MFKQPGTFRARRDIRIVYGAAIRRAAFALSLFVAGVAAGAVLFAALGPVVRAAAASDLRSGLQSGFTGGHAAGGSPFRGAFFGSATQVAWLLFLWLAGQAPTGQAVIVPLIALRGISLGLALCLVVGAYGPRGIGFDLLGVLPSNILTAGGLILGATAGATLSALMRRAGPPRVPSVGWLAYHGAFLLAIGLALTATWVQLTTLPGLSAWLLNP